MKDPAHIRKFRRNLQIVKERAREFDLEEDESEESIDPNQVTNIIWGAIAGAFIIVVIVLTIGAFS